MEGGFCPSKEAFLEHQAKESKEPGIDLVGMKAGRTRGLTRQHECRFQHAPLHCRFSYGRLRFSSKKISQEIKEFRY